MSERAQSGFLISLFLTRTSQGFDRVKLITEFAQASARVRDFDSCMLAVRELRAEIETLCTIVAAFPDHGDEAKALAHEAAGHISQLSRSVDVIAELATGWCAS